MSASATTADLADVSVIAVDSEQIQDTEPGLHACR
jgi:hypothetical protein